jgi:hypothetical protein
MRLMFVDPGKMTGWFVIDTTTQAFMGGELEHFAFLDWTDLSSEYTNSPLTMWHLNRVVTEKFDITPTTYQAIDAKQPLWAVEQIGVLRYWCRVRKIPFELQSRTAKKWADNDKLRKIGWYAPAAGVKGEAGHRRDAARHALKWCVDHQLIDPGVLL